MKSLKILLTFDHELPLGGLNTSFEKALFEPSEKVMRIASELNVRVNFFSDILCATHFKEWDNERFYLPYAKQLQFAIANGHDVQLHLHPHWLTTEFLDGNFIPSNDFSLSAFQNKKYPGNIAGIIEKGISALSVICTEVNQNYKCVAYRGGGYNLSPASEEIFSALIQNGIRFDSTICKGYYFKSGLQEVDFSNMPASPNWFIDIHGNFKKEATNGVLEVPIASKPKSIFEVPTSFKLKKYQSRAPVFHGQQIHEKMPAGFYYRFRQMFSSRMLNFDNYTYNADFNMKILDHYVKKHPGSETIIVSTIAHPKSMSDYCFSMFTDFVKQSRRKYGEDLQFCTFTQLFKEMFS